MLCALLTASLESHIKKSHNPYCALTNSALIAEQFDDIKLDLAFRISALNWMSEVDMCPFPFRSNIYRKIKKDKLKQDLHRTVASLLVLCAKATKPLRTASTHTNYEAMRNVIWMLLVAFQGCILCPLPWKRSKCQYIGRVVDNHLRRFHSGHVEDLWVSAMAIPCL